MQRIFIWLIMFIIISSSGVTLAQAKEEPLQKQLQELREQVDELRMDYDLLQEESEGMKLRLDNYTLKIFWNITFMAEDTDDETEERSNTFTMGQFDVFLTARLTDRLSILAENVVEFGEHHGESEIELCLERLWIKYELSDLLKLKVGRMHFATGYWNTAYHHGTWLQTSIFRPQMLKWEHDMDSVLPMHMVGLEFSGGLSGDNLAVEYILQVVNGRGRKSHEVQMVQDDNDHKATNFYLRLEPAFIPGLQLGGNIYYDKIPPDPDEPTRVKEINELIWGGYLAYLQGDYELLAEALQIEHEDKTSAEDFKTIATYVQAGYQINSFKPYYRFDHVDYEVGDPFYSPHTFDLKQHTLGLRWDVVSWNAIKLEGSFSDWKGKSDSKAIAINTSFHF